MNSKRKIACVFSCLFAVGMAQGETLLKDPVADLSESVARPEIENLGWSGITLAPGVTLGGLFEVSALYEKADEESSDINVDTVEFTLGAALREDLNTEVVFLWEEGEEKDIIIDSAVIEYGGTDEFPLVLGFGRLYLGFGNFTSAMITDPLTLELGEIRSTAATAFYEEGPFAVRATVFDGELDNADSIENAAVWFSFSPIDILTLGFSAVTDIGEGGYADDINDVLAEGGSYDKTAGISAFIFLELDKISVSAEYLCAASDMTLTDADDEVFEWRQRGSSNSAMPSPATGAVPCATKAAATS